MSGIPWRSSSGGCGGAGPGLTPDDREQVLVVGAGRDVAVGVGARLALVVLLLEPVAARVVGRLRAGRRLGVDARHHDDAVVVARRGERLLDLVEAALAEELLVDLLELLRFLLGEVLVVGGPDVVAVLERVLDRLLEQLEGVRLADDARRADRLRRRLALALLLLELDRRLERARARHLAAGLCVARLVGRGIGPVGGALDVAEGDSAGSAAPASACDDERQAPVPAAPRNSSHLSAEVYPWIGRRRGGSPRAPRRSALSPPRRSGARPLPS